jgi:hypothetical protein
LALLFRPLRSTWSAYVQVTSLIQFCPVDQHPGIFHVLPNPLGQPDHETRDIDQNIVSQSKIDSQRGQTLADLAYEPEGIVVQFEFLGKKCFPCHAASFLNTASFLLI